MTKIQTRKIKRAFFNWREQYPVLIGPLPAPLQPLRDHIRPNLTAFSSDRTLLIWLLAILIGVGVGYIALGFRWAIGIVQLPWLGTMSERVYEAASPLPWYVILAAPIVGGIIVGQFLHRFMPGKRAQAVADVIEARVLHRCHIPLKTGLGSAFVAIVSLGFGASAGREGPVVHLGASLASSLQNIFDLSKAARRTLLGCGVAAAVSASFNAPIAGVLFAHEVILAHYAFRAFVPITIASVIGSLITRMHHGNLPTFTIPDYEIVSYWEFPAFALLGLVCGLIAIVMQFSIIYSDRLARTVPIPLYIRPVIGGFFVGLIAIAFPQILGVGYDVTEAALHERIPLGLLLCLIAAKMLATAITLASRFGGGIFSPALVLGAMTGGSFGIIASSIFPDLASSHGAYAVIGMGAVAATVLGAPISTTLMVFELTSSYALTIALLLSTSIALGLSHALHGISFFHWQLRDRGLALNEGQHKHILRSIRVSEFMNPVEDNEQPLKLDKEKYEHWILKDHIVETALRTFNESGQDRLPVILADQEEPTIIGWADHTSALSAVNQALIDAHIEEHK